ncbi:Aryl-hydrocarbon-interacting protein-like 1 [Blastocladiella emersonii ATCC 22665]|nr:Aryl-hydrocarbon-interacting protein-like 1 [Blastocladiella emersonii ATCC 22665]
MNASTDSILTASGGPGGSSKMEKVTDDGGIVKAVLRPPTEPAAEIRWVKGTNARLHYTVSTAPFVLANPPKIKPASASKKKAAHKHSSACSHGHDHGDDHGCAAEEPKPIEPPKPGEPVFASPSGVAYRFDPSARRVLADTARDDGETELFELRMGRQFTFKALEAAVQTMRVGETSKFLVSPEYAEGFIQLETVLRKERAAKLAAKEGRPRPPTCCMGMAADAEAHADLYASADVPLELTVTLHAVQQPDEFVPEAWEVSAVDKYNAIPSLKAAGAAHWAAGDAAAARDAYRRALEWTEGVQAAVADARREGTQPAGHAPPLADGEGTRGVSCAWLDDTHLALRLNMALCTLHLGEYELAVVQCTQILGDKPGHPKALFRRALAHLRRGRDLELAQADLEAVVAGGGMARDDRAWAEAWAELTAKWKRARASETRMWRGLFA